MNPNVAKCLLVSKVLVADGIMTDDEHAFLDGVMKKLGLTDAERQAVVELDDWDQAEPIVNALSVDDRRELVDLLVEAASADGHLAPLELSSIRQIAKALGVES